MARLEIRQVSKIFTDHTAVSDVSLTVNDGEFLVLLGPSGCGKSTLLRMIAGLGYSLATLSSATALRHASSRRIAILRWCSRTTRSIRTSPSTRISPFPAGSWHQSWWWMRRSSGRPVYGINNPETQARQMSGGERQRTATARSLVRDPDVFLLDEPLSNLEAQAAPFGSRELRQFQDRVGVTSDYVTHDQVEAMGLGTASL